MNEVDSSFSENLHKFNTYDIFGFMVPGAVLATGIYLHTKIFTTIYINIKLSSLFASLNLSENNWPKFISMSLICLFCLYICGHIVALLSSAIIDKLLVERTQGYPFHHLFNKKIPMSSYAWKMKNFYKTIICLFLIPALYVSIKGLNEWKLILCMSIPTGIFIFLKILMSFLILRQIDDPYSVRNNNDIQKRIAEALWKYFFHWSLKPFVWIFDFFSKSLLTTLRMYKPFTEDLQNLFINKFKQVFNGLDPTDIDTEVHWLTYSYICQNHPESNELIRHWLTCNRSQKI